MFRLISSLFCIFTTTSAFTLPNKPIIREATIPFKNIDLFNQDVVAKNVQPSFLREAELKHCRIAMCSSILLPLSEQFSDKLGINFFQDNPSVVVFSLSLMFISEFSSMIRGWENPLIKPFTLKSDYQPGDLGFTFGLTNASFENLMDKELNNGRLAMFGILGMISQELITHQPLF